MKYKNRIVLIGVAVGSICSSPSFAISSSTEHHQGNYSDVGQVMGMEWYFQNKHNKPALAFGVKDVGYWFWKISCDGTQKRDKIAVKNIILVKHGNVRVNDEFGLTIRIDDRQSHGVTGKMKPYQGLGYESVYPQFYVSDKDDFWNDLRRGSRAFINLNGNKFSVHLEGSSSSVKSFIKACQKMSFQKP